MYFSNYPPTLLPDFKDRITLNNVVHLVVEKEGKEINCRLWGGETKSGKTTTKLWGPLVRVGAYGLNWKTKTIEWIGLDIDAKNDGPIQKPGDKDVLVNQLASLKYCEVRNSSSGAGLHVYVKLANPIPNVNSEKEYAAYRNALATIIENDLRAIGGNYPTVFDRVGTVLYMWKSGSKEGAYQLLRPAEILFDKDLVPETKNSKRSLASLGRLPSSPEDAIIKGWTNEQYKFIIYLAQHDQSFTPSPSEGVACQAHTTVVDAAIRSLGIPGYWSTNTPGTDLSHHNCYITMPSNSNVIRIWRAGNGTTAETDAWTEVGGRTVAIVNGVARSKLCVLSGLRALTKADRARGPIGCDVLKKLNIPYSDSWDNIEANIQVNTSKVKFIVKGKRDPKPGWVIGATQMTYTLDIDEGLHLRQVSESNVHTETDDIKVQYTRDDGNEMIVYFENEKKEWQHSTNDALLRAYLQQRYNLSSADVKRILAMKYANDVMTRVEMPCIPFGKFEYEGRTYWNVPPTDYAFPKVDTTPVLSRISYIEPSLQQLADECPGWFALYNHIFAELRVPKEVKDHYSIETGADYGLLWAAYKIRDPLNIVPILVLTGPPETGKTFFADSFRHFYTGRGAYKMTNVLTSNYGDWAGVVVGSSDDLNDYPLATITRLKNIGSGDRLEVNPKFKRPSLVGGYLSLILNMQDLSAFPKDQLSDRCTFVEVKPINDEAYSPKFFTSGCRDVYDKRIHARIPSVHWTLSAQAESFFKYLCSIQLPVPFRRYALPIAGSSK